ncbi:hypothetical protein Trydic_g19200, partial [Trypoxylus dichotomus]
AHQNMSENIANIATPAIRVHDARMVVRVKFEYRQEHLLVSRAFVLWVSVPLCAKFVSRTLVIAVRALTVVPAL